MKSGQAMHGSLLLSSERHKTRWLVQVCFSNGGNCSAKKNDACTSSCVSEKIWFTSKMLIYTHGYSTSNICAMCEVAIIFQAMDTLFSLFLHKKTMLLIVFFSFFVILPIFLFYFFSCRLSMVWYINLPLNEPG